MNCSSLLAQNLDISQDGKSLVTIKNTEKGAQIMTYSPAAILDTSA